MTFKQHMMTASNGSIFRVASPLCVEFTGHRWIPLTKSSDVELWCSLLSTPEQTVGYTMETPVVWDAIALLNYDVAVMNVEICWLLSRQLDTSFHSNCRFDFLYHIQTDSISMISVGSCMSLTMQWQHDVWLAGRRVTVICWEGKHTWSSSILW